MIPDSETIEGNPWKGLSYAVFTVQFMLITLDLFMDTAPQPGWHYAITAIEFAFSLYLSGYISLRLVSVTLCIKEAKALKAKILLLFSLLMQLGIAALSAYSFTLNNSTAEWLMFIFTLVYGVANPLSFDAVEAVVEAEAEAAGASEDKEGAVEGEDEEIPKKKKKKKRRMGPGAAAFSIFTRHFTRTPLLSVVGTLFAVGTAILNTMQGGVINELTRAVTRVEVSEGEITRLSTILLLVWLGHNIARCVFDFISALMFSRLEVWLRDSVFTAAASSSSRAGSSSMTSADFQARYASDVTGVVTLYSTMLRGVVVNVLLIITNFVFLALYEWHVAAVSLGFLAIGVNSGPTDMAGRAARKVQDEVTDGLALLGKISDSEVEAAEKEDSSSSAKRTEEQEVDLAERHRTEVLSPLRTDLFRRRFYSNSVDSYIHFYSSFLTTVVVITMSWQVYEDDLKGSDFLGIFFVFKELQKPALKISGVVKSCASKTANLERINAMLFPEADTAAAEEGGGDVKEKATAEEGGDDAPDGRSRVVIPSPPKIERRQPTRRDVEKEYGDRVARDAVKDETID